MSTKEFIKKQVEKFSSHITPEEFADLTEAENSLIILDTFERLHADRNCANLKATMLM